MKLQINQGRFLKASLASAIAMTSCYSMADFNSTDTDYSNSPQKYHVWNEALRPIELVNSILCFTEQMKFNHFINQGPYLALVDESACFEDSGDDASTAQSSGAANTPTYTKIIIDSARASANDPLVVRAWMTDMSGEAIKFKAVIAAGADEENPFGSFTFNYNFFPDIDSTEANGGGEIKTVDVSGKIGFTFYESENREEGSSTKSASVVMSADRSSGVALTSTQDSSEFGSQGGAYGLAFNTENVLMQEADSYANLPYQEDNDGSGSERCLSRTAFDETVHRYDLFDATTGAQIEIKSGIAFKYDSDNDDETDSYGHVGYWGLWTEQEGALNSGDTVFSDDRTGSDPVAYTILKAPGRLIKNTVEQLALTESVGIDFNYWAPDAQEAGFQNWIVHYLTTDDGVETNGLYKVAGNQQGEEGWNQVPLMAPVMIELPQHGMLFMNSEQLGGNVKYVQGDNFVTFFKQEFINGSEIGEGQLLAEGSITLHCVNRCPVGNLGAEQLAGWDTPYAASVDNIDNAISYSFSVAGDNALTLVRTNNSESVAFSGEVTRESLEESHSPHMWGVRSGAMVTADVLAQLTNPWDFSDPEKVSVFYEWETGVNNWNQLVSLKDANNNIVTFDKPIQFKYTHNDINDRSGDAGESDGKVLMLNYGGNGELWGIPGQHTENGRYQSAFAIADGTLMGADNLYVIKAREIEGTMQEADVNACDNLVLTEPEAPVPTSVTGNTDLGTMPVVTSSPAVIGGVVQDTTE